MPTPESNDCPVALCRDERLTHMQVLELTLPSDFELLRKQRKEASLISTKLEILENPERSAGSIHIR